MQAGGNAAMIAWWKDHNVNPRSSIRDKYSHPSTQLYRQKIKCVIEVSQLVISCWAGWRYPIVMLKVGCRGESSLKQMRVDRL